MSDGDLAEVEVRLLVVSPLATGLPPDWLGRRWRDLSSATTPKEALDAVGPGRRRFDVVLIDLMWNHFDDEWHFDGLDLLAAMELSQQHEWVIFACQGHGFERDYLDEVHNRLILEGRTGHVRGLILKGSRGSPLEAVLTVAAGGTYVDNQLERYLRPIDRTVHHWFSKSVRLPRFAGALAAGHPIDYDQLAELLHTSKGYLHKTPALFKEMLVALGGIGLDEEVNLATVARWSGEHAHYIISWCRRHGTKLPEFGGLSETLRRIQTNEPTNGQGF